jgi:hypothetical protein
MSPIGCVYRKPHLVMLSILARKIPSSYGKSVDWRPTLTPIRNHELAGAADVTSSVITLKPASVHGPNEVTIATSVASRPRAIKMRPMRGTLLRESKVYQRPPR